MDAERTDRELVARIAAGDRRALESLYARHRDRLWAYIRRTVADDHLAEEALAETLVALWRHAGSFRGESRVTTWLIGIARHQIHEHLRRRRPEPVDPAAAATLVEPGAGPERVVSARAELDDVLAAIDGLGPEHRETLLLAVAGDLSYAEIAGLLGVPVGTVKSRVNTARRLLAPASSDEVAR